ncbi:MAG: hypothetical protein RID07_01450, partial [Lacipirellulaceae bacterium]
MHQTSAWKIGLRDLSLVLVVYNLAALQGKAANPPQVLAASRESHLREAALDYAKEEGKDELLKWYTGELNFQGKWVKPTKAEATAARD